MKRRIALILSILILATLSCSFTSLLGNSGSGENTFTFGEREITIKRKDENHSEEKVEGEDDSDQTQDMGKEPDE